MQMLELTYMGKNVEKLKVIGLFGNDLRKVLHEAIFFPHPEYNTGTLKVDEPAAINRDSIIDVTGNITIGKNSMISDNTRIYTHEHYLEGHDILLNVQAIKGVKWLDKKIGSDVWINANTIVLMKCNEISDGVFIGAGSIVTKPILEPYTIWAGNPAKKIGNR